MPSQTLPPLTDEWLEEISAAIRGRPFGTVQTVSWEQIRAEAVDSAGFSYGDRYHESTASDYEPR